MDDQRPPTMKVPGPDGQSYDFPSDATDAEILEFFQAREKPAAPPSMLNTALDTPVQGLPISVTPRQVGDAVVGAGKGALHTVTTLGNLVRRIPGITQADAAIGSVPLPMSAVTPANTAQKLGYGAEQMAEAVAPSMAGARLATMATRGAPAVVRLGGQMFAGAATNAATGVAQGHEHIGRDAAIGAVGPAAGAGVSGAVKLVGKLARPLVQSGLKTPVSILADQAGAGREGIDQMSKDIADTVIEHRLHNPSIATDVVNREMGAVDDAVAANAQVPTDVNTRIAGNLDHLAQSARTLATGEPQLAKIAAKRAAVLEGPFGETVQTPTAHPQVFLPVRQMRPTVPAGEVRAATLARSGWNQGEYDDALIESAVDSAERDALKDAVPETVPHFETAGRVINARKALRLASVRDANRDMAGLAGTLGAVSGNPAHAALGGAMQAFKNGQLHLGIWADQFRSAMQAGDTVLMGQILQKAGVKLASDAAQPGAREANLTLSSDGSVR